MYKVLIVEDYPDEAAALRDCLERYAEKHSLDLSIETSETARGLVAGNRTFDLVFLDIELPGMSGMEAATLLRSFDAATPVVFTTSLSQYAAKSYEVDAAGFIVKPVTMPKLEMIMDKVSSRLRATGTARIVIPTSGGVRVLPVRDIVYVELVRHDLVFHMADGEQPKMRGTIKQVVDQVSEGSPFLQISSGCVVNMDYVRLIKGADVQLSDGTALPLSRARRKDAVDAFSAYMGLTF